MTLSVDQNQIMVRYPFQCRDTFACHTPNLEYVGKDELPPSFDIP